MKKLPLALAGLAVSMVALVGATAPADAKAKSKARNGATKVSLQQSKPSAPRFDATTFFEKIERSSGGG
jgi:hypothetical protein